MPRASGSGIKRRYKSIGSTTRPKAICSQTASQAKIYQSKQPTSKSIKDTEPYGALQILKGPYGARWSLTEP